MDQFTGEARRLLLEYRNSQSDEKHSSKRTSSRSTPEPDFTYKEVNHVLDEVVNRDGPVGLVEALLELGADVNLARRKTQNVWKKISRKNGEDQRSDLLLRVVARNEAEIVAAIAKLADQENLDTVLSVAISRADVNVLRVLMQNGADPADYHVELEDAVRRNDFGIASTLAAGSKRPRTRCLSNSACIAIKNGAMDMLEVLVKAGADPNAFNNNGNMLLCAVDAWRPDFLATLLAGPTRARPENVDVALGKTVQAMQIMEDSDSDHGNAMVEMCLRAGAAGPMTDGLLTKGMVEAVSRRQHRLLKTILDFRKPSDQFDTLALSEAVRTEQEQALRMLLVQKPSSDSLTTAVANAMQIDDAEVRHELMAILIDGGAKGSCVAEALVQVVRWLVTDRQYGSSPTEQNNRDLFALILEEGKSDVDYSGGEALRSAVKGRCIDLVWEILSKEPHPSTLGRALALALKASHQEEKETLVDMLCRYRIEEEAVNLALVEAVQSGPSDRAVTATLLSRASVNYNNGQVFTLAIRKMDLETLRILLTRTPSEETLMTAAGAALSCDKEDRRIVFQELSGHLTQQVLDFALRDVALELDVPDLELVRCLLRDGASATHHEGICIRHAAANHDTELVRMLAKAAGKKGTQAIFSQAFFEVINTNRGWISFEAIELVDILMTHGASGDAVSRALGDVVDHLAGDKSATGKQLADHFIATLIAAGADLDWNEGDAVTKAALKGDVRLLRILLGLGPTPETSSRALTSAFSARHSEDGVIDLMDVFLEHESTPPDVNIPIGDNRMPLFLCLDLYPASIPLLQRLYALGADLEVKTTGQVFPDDTASTHEEKEEMTALVWALSQPDDRIGEPVIASLIELGADVSYQTADTLATPLILAAKTSRLKTVELLLDAGAKPSAKDKFGRSALFHAAKTNKVAMVAALLKSKPSVNDGSLHVASRFFKAEIVSLLLKAGHDADYRSTKHGGRTALGEMALRGQVPSDVGQAEEAVDLLKSAGADSLVKTDGKTIIFLALDNRDAQPVTRILLDRVLWKTLNDESNTYQQGNYFYSPTMYLLKGVRKGEVPSTLLQMLKDHGAVDRYYAAMECTQPYDAVGLPADIVEFEKLRRARQLRLQREEEEHEIALRRETEQAMHRTRIADLQHDTAIRHSEHVVQQKLRSRELEQKQELEMAVQKHQVQLVIQMGEADAESRAKWLAHQDDTAMLAAARAADRDQRLLTHKDESTIKAETRMADREHKLITYHDTRAMQADSRAATLEHQRLAQAQKIAAIVEKRQLEAASREQTHGQLLTFRQQEFQQRKVEHEQIGQLRLQLEAASHTQQTDQKGLDREQKRTHKLLLDQQRVRAQSAERAHSRAMDMQDIEARRAKAVQTRDEAESTLGMMREAHGMRMEHVEGRRLGGVSTGQTRSVSAPPRKMITGPEVEEVEDEDG